MKMLVLGILLFVCAGQHAIGQTTDTVSTEGIEFTEITEAPADTVVQPKAEAKVESAVRDSLTNNKQ